MDLTTLPDTEKWLIFTDLDGTLLDHHNYSFSAAKPELNQLNQLGIPVILNSSKTLAEIAQIADDLNLDTPQIAENGSIIYYPKEKITHTLGADYKSICSVLDNLRQVHKYAFNGFHDWNAEEIAACTGLELQAAHNAAQRQGSEPLLWEDDEALIEDFRKHLQEHSLELKRGGRFWHVMGQTDKVEAMHFLQNEYKKDSGSNPFLIALGDSANDKDMLTAANIAIIVKNPKGTPFTIDSAKTPTPHHLIKTTLEGPSGWNEAITELLNGPMSK